MTTSRSRPPQSDRLVGVEHDVHTPQPLIRPPIPQRDLGPDAHSARTGLLPKRHKESALLGPSHGSREDLAQGLTGGELMDLERFGRPGHYGLQLPDIGAGGWSQERERQEEPSHERPHHDQLRHSAIYLHTSAPSLRGPQDGAPLLL